LAPGNATRGALFPLRHDLVRTIGRAELFEISAVTVPAYPAAQVEARSWATDQAAPSDSGRALKRWRL